MRFRFGNTFAAVHLLLLFVGKVAQKPVFSTHKMCEKSEHQKCRKHEKWILRAEYTEKVVMPQTHTLSQRTSTTNYLRPTDETDRRKRQNSSFKQKNTCETLQCRCNELFFHKHGRVLRHRRENIWFFFCERVIILSFFADDRVGVWHEKRFVIWHNKWTVTSTSFAFYVIVVRYNHMSMGQHAWRLQRNPTTYSQSIQSVHFTTPHSRVLIMVFQYVRRLRIGKSNNINGKLNHQRLILANINTTSVQLLRQRQDDVRERS